MKKILSLLLALLLLLSPRAFANGPCIVDMRASYRHPATGVIEDSGKNEGIGQGMAEGVLHPQALYEEVGGKRLLTIRLHMMDNVSKVGIAVQRKGASGFSNASYDTPQGAGEWKDFRFQLPAKECVIRLSLFIDAMGREVIFYGDMGKMTPGNTDFVLSAGGGSAQKAAAPSAQKAAAPAKSPSASQAKVNSASPGKAPAATPASPSPVADASQDASAPDENADTTTHGGDSGLGDTESDIGYEHGLLTEDSPEIQSLENGEDAHEDKDKAREKKAPWGPATRIVFASMMAVLVFVTCGALASAAVFYVLAQRKRTLNELSEEEDNEDFDFEDF